MLSYEEYKSFVEATKRAGGMIRFHATFPTDAQQQAALKESHTAERLRNLLEACETARQNILTLISAYPERFERHAFQGTHDLLAEAIKRAKTD